MWYHTIKKNLSKILYPQGHEQWKDLLLSIFFIQGACSITNINYILILNKYSNKTGKTSFKKFQGILLTTTFGNL